MKFTFPEQDFQRIKRQAEIDRLRLDIELKEREIRHHTKMLELLNEQEAATPQT